MKMNGRDIKSQNKENKKSMNHEDQIKKIDEERMKEIKMEIEKFKSQVNFCKINAEDRLPPHLKALKREMEKRKHGIRITIELF